MSARILMAVVAVVISGCEFQYSSKPIEDPEAQQ